MTKKNKRKLIIFITIDNLRKDFENIIIRALPRSWGMYRFKNFFSVGPYTWSSFPAIFTSTYTYIMKYNPFKGIVNRVSFVEILRKNKFITIGMNDSNPFLTRETGYSKGFDYFAERIKSRYSETRYLRYIEYLMSLFKKEYSGETKCIKTPLSYLLLAVPTSLSIVFNDFISNHRSLFIDSCNLIRNALEKLAKYTRIYSRNVFLWLHFMDLHFPYSVYVRELHGLHSLIDLTIEYLSIIYGINTSEKNLKYLKDMKIRYYESSACYVSKCLNIFFKLIQESIEKLFDIVNVVITSDHGEEFLEHGAIGHQGFKYLNIRIPHLYNELLHVPFIISGTCIQGFKEVEMLSSHYDIAPTLLRIADIFDPIEKLFIGREILLLDNDRLEPNPKYLNNVYYIFSESDGAIIKHIAGLSTYGVATSIIGNRYKFITHPYTGEELYDLKNDPQEKQNLVESLPSIVREFKKIYLELKKRKYKLEIRYKLHFKIKKHYLHNSPRVIENS